jgi:AAA domain (dynein-related subfamily)
MKTYPNQILERSELNLRNGIKSSLAEIKELFALTFSLYLASNKEVLLNYSKEVNSPNTKIEIKDDLQLKLELFFNDLITDKVDFKIKVNENPLLTAQMESLQVSLELFWKICKIDFIENYPSSQERTGGKRFEKKITFACNTLLLENCLLENDGSVSESLKQILFNWIMKSTVFTPDLFLLNKIQSTLTVFSEETQFKIRKDDGSELFFQQEGIYEQVIAGNTVIDKDNIEPVGPFRILKSFIKSDLHSYLNEDGSDGFRIKAGKSIHELGGYNEMVKTSLNLIPKRTIIYEEHEITPLQSVSSQDVNNVIFYGSPGTGKSYRADIETNGKDVRKVTFHPDYDYHSFVGGYKPTMDGEKIAYKFVPQIFTKIYIDAWKNLVSADETKPFYLQIEEINRGNCAEIFGDLFQLLDRDKDGFSKYEVTAEEELYKYLLSADGFGTTHEGIKDGKLRFPSNLKIIATMNTSDQSLFPMDSAFKRRWDWIYVPIDTNCKFSDFTIKLDNGKAFEWLSFLKEINKEIFEITKSQDKQIGNWFIDAQNSGKVISESTFVNKVVFYLWNDVFKDEENTIFMSADGKNLTYTSFFENGTSNNLVSYILEERLKLTNVGKVETTTTVEE